MHRVVIKYKSSYITKIYVLFIIFTLEYYSPSMDTSYELLLFIILRVLRTSSYCMSMDTTRSIHNIILERSTTVCIE